MVLVPINTFKVGSPQVRIETVPNFLDNTATHYYMYTAENNTDLSFSLPSGIDSQGRVVTLDNIFYNTYDSNVDGNGNPIYIRN